jgi:pimeloyl-ACP methyl ester carboxylesterase
VPREGQIDVGGGSVAWREWGNPSGQPVVFLTEIVGRIAEDRHLETFAVVGFSGGGPYALACGVFSPDRVSRLAVVSSGGPIDELEQAYASLTTNERELLSAVRADPGEATTLLWEAGQEFAETPLRSVETGEAGDEPISRDPAVRSNVAASNLEAARQGQAGLIGDWVAEALPWGFGLADVRVPVDVWVGERDPGRAPLDAAEIVRRIPSCSLHLDAHAGHWLLIPRGHDILERALPRTRR